MRKVTEKASQAFKNGQNFTLSNTEVFSGEGVTKMFLHGNRIACYNLEFKRLTICSAGWFTNVTKERLNGILDAFGLGFIFQKNFNWFYKAKDGTVKPFEDYMQFSI